MLKFSKLTLENAALKDPGKGFLYRQPVSIRVALNIFSIIPFI